MNLSFGLKIDQAPEVRYVHSVSQPASFKLDFGSVEIRLAANEAEKLLEGLAREVVLMREQATMKGRAQ